MVNFIQKEMMKRLLCAAVFSAVVCGAFAIRPDRTYIRRPEALGLMYRELEVVTDDGMRLAVWFFPAQQPLSDAEFSALGGARRAYAADGGRHSTVVICNGDAGNMSYFQLHLARALTARGFNVATFDWRGFGESAPFEMNPDWLCCTGMLHDYRAVVDAVARQPEVRRRAIAVMGWSTGAYLSMMTAHANRHVRAFVGRSLATDFGDFVPLVMQVRGKSREQLIVPPDFPAERMPVHIAPRFRKAVFLINGDRDLRTPLWMSRRILELLPERTPRELMVVEGAAHGGMEDPMLLDFDRFIDRVSAFLSRNLPSR